MVRDHDGGFFAGRVHQGRGHRHQPGPGPEPEVGVLGIVGLSMVVFGIAWTLLAGNLGGLIGMPIMLLGTVLGAIAWWRDRADRWGRAAVMVTAALYVLTTVAALTGLI